MTRALIGQQQQQLLINSPLEQAYINSASPLNPLGDFSTPQQFEIVGEELQLVLPTLRSPDEQLEKDPRFREPIASQNFLSPEQTQAGASAVPAQNVGISPYGNSFFQGEIQGPALVPGKTGALPNLFETIKKQG